MIFTDRTITIRNNKSIINDPVILYRGDYEVSIKFTIMESKFRFKSGANLVYSEKASYGQLVVLAPYGGNVFSDIVKCEDGTVTFTLTKEMIDQLEEVGLYSFQIRLFDYYRESRVSIPPVEFGIEVREPVASEDHDNEINNAIVGYSIAKVVDGLNEDVGPIFDNDGNYNKTNWETGDRISQGKLNKIEDALDTINQNEINNKNFLNKQMTSNFNVLQSRIDNIVIGSGGGNNVDLSGYATKDELNNKADKSELHSHANKAVLDEITANKVTIWDNKSDFNGDYNSLTNKPDIPSIEGLATENYVKNAIANAQLSGDDEVIDLSGYATKDELNNKADTKDIPTKVSQLENDSKFLTSVPSEYITESELNNILANNGNGSVFKLSDFTVSNSDVIRQSGNTYYVDALATQGYLVRCNLDSSRKLFLFKAERGMYWLTLGSDTSNTYTTIVAIGPAQPGKVVIMNNSSNSIHKVIRNQSNDYVNTGASYSVGSTVELQLTDSKLIITINNITYMEVPFSLITGDDTQYIATKHLGFYLNISYAEVYNNNPTIFLSDPSYGKSNNIDLSEYVKRSELDDIIRQINVLRRDLDTLLQNNGSLYYNPTMTIENDRAVFREDGYEERFLITHVENKNDPNYKGSVQVKGSDGYEYYVLLTDNAESTNSKFRYNNLIPSHGGWMSFENKANQPYQFVPDRTYPYRNGFNFTDTVENVDGSVNSDLLNKALEHFNLFFPAVNMQVAASATNKIKQQTVSDPWWGAHYPYGSYFEIIINEGPIKNWGGPYGEGKYEYSDRGCWIHTVLHEFGHSLGLKDQPKHDPSLFNYDASYEQIAGELFLQPNDFCALNYFYKQHYNLDITPETTQEDVNNQLAQNAQVATFANELYDLESEDTEIFMDFSYPTFNTTSMKVEASDVIVRCRLNFDKEEKIQITKDGLDSLSLTYKVFNIEPLETIKGELVNNKLKIHISENINIDENAEYLAYLVNYEDVPCSLINPTQGLEKIS